ncbi:MAG: TIGR03915 family putative DNA repair protein [Lachnospiraceae bacterium]|nr:TIGR03915 family putative DNA repair protein [Lachnospiraceae bacterium]
MTIFLCKNGFDGILCGVYDAYASKLDLGECRLEMEEEYEPVMFAEYREVEVEAWKAERVAKKIQNHMSEEAYVHLYRAALHNSPDRADWILRFIILGLKYGRRVVKMLQEPAVYEIFQMDRYVGREAHFHREFARFERLKSGVYYGKVGPVNQVLELVADHFADRFPDMDWVLYDEKHKAAAVHGSNGNWMIHHGVTEEDIQKLTEQSEPDVYIDLWKTFFHTIAIEERRNYRCQRTMLPLRYRKYITEFQ